LKYFTGITIINFTYLDAFAGVFDFASYNSKSQSMNNAYQNLQISSVTFRDIGTIKDESSKNLNGIMIGVYHGCGPDLSKPR
jgi:hypothetical protein